MKDVWAMPLVLRIEKSSPPRRTDLLEAAARAVLGLTHDPRARSEWAPNLRAWNSGPFRKVARRARGARWDEVQALPGVSVSHGSAEVRAFPPSLVSETPPLLRRLQVTGTDLPLEPPGPEREAPTLWLNPHVPMSVGKAAAQVGHGAMMLAAVVDDTDLESWKRSGFDLQVRTASSSQWASLTASAPVVVRDAGYTEVEPGTATVTATYERI